MEAEKIFKKLRFDKAANPLIVSAPEEFTAILKETQHDTKPSKKKEGQYDFVMVFATMQAELEKRFREVAKAGENDCLFWAAYPKMSGKIKSDIKRETVWTAFDLVGLQPVTSISLDDTWTALRARPADRVGK